MQDLYPLTLFALTASLIDYGPIPRRGDGLAGISGCSQPGCFGPLHFGQGGLRRIAKSRTGFQVRDIGNVAAVFLTVKDIDMVIAHKIPLPASKREEAEKLFFRFEADIITLHQTQELADLIRLRLAANILQVHKFRAIWLAEDMMAAADPQKAETKALHQIAKVSKGDVLKMPLNQSAEELFSVHCPSIPKESFRFN